MKESIHMADGFLFALTLLSALGCGLMAGVFFAFSAFVMQGLARLPPAQGIAAMKSINVAAISPLFMSAFFGTAVSCLILIVTVLESGDEPGAIYLIAGGLLYLAGTVVVTILFNVPRNNTLAAVEAECPDASVLWARYVSGWTAWNHVRMAAALLAAASLTIGLVLQIRKP